MTYLSFIHYITGLGNAAIFSRIVGLGVNAGLYWNFTTLDWDVESANTKVFMTEYPSADTVESLYQENITLPDSSNIYIIETVRNSTGRVIGSDDTYSSRAIYLDTSISSRMPVSGYSAPDNTTITNIYNEVLNPSILAREASVLAISGGSGGTTDLTVLINALAALQTDLGDPSLDSTTIYAQLLLVKGYVDELETRLTLQRTANLDNLDATISSISTAVSGNSTINVTLGGGATEFQYAEDGAVINIFQGDDLNQPFIYLGNSTGKTLYFILHEDYIENNTVPTFLIGPRTLTGWTAQTIKGKVYTSGAIPFVYNDTKDLKIGNEYPFEIKEKDSLGNVITPLSGKLVIKSVVAKKVSLT